VTALSNGNYVVRSRNWNGLRGAVTWASGTAGVTGVVSAANSLVGSNPNERVGIFVTALSNGNYGVSSPDWNGNRGAVTWVNGSSGRTVDGRGAVVSPQNSLVGQAVNARLFFAGENPIDQTLLASSATDGGNARVYVGVTDPDQLTF